jgi:hypothetical protein
MKNKIVAAIGKNIRVINQNENYVIEEFSSDVGKYVEWTTIRFASLWDALREISKEICYREAIIK